MWLLDRRSGYFAKISFGANSGASLQVGVVLAYLSVSVRVLSERQDVAADQGIAVPAKRAAAGSEKGELREMLIICSDSSYEGE